MRRRFGSSSLPPRAAVSLGSSLSLLFASSGSSISALSFVRRGSIVTLLHRFLTPLCLSRVLQESEVLPASLIPVLAEGLCQSLREFARCRLTLSVAGLLTRGGSLLGCLIVIESVIVSSSFSVGLICVSGLDRFYSDRRNFCQCHLLPSRFLSRLFPVGQRLSRFGKLHSSEFVCSPRIVFVDEWGS
jgi:hypothetical protein